MASIINLVNLLYLIVLIFVESSSCLPLVMVPKTFRLFTKENVVVLPLSDEAFLLEIKSKDKTYYTKYFPKSPKDPFKLPIELGANVSTGEARLSVINRNGDENSSVILITGDTGFGFIQTDKPIYTPKEKVKIRCMRLNDDLQPISDKVRISIKNPHKIVMDEVTFEAPSNGYFIDYEFTIPPDPIKNMWIVLMAYGPDFSVTANATFEVKEYILPPFEVKLKSLPYITPSTGLINGTVTATYLNGKKVSGTVRFRFKVRDKINSTIGIGQTEELPLDKGQASYKFSSNEFTESGIEIGMVIGSQLVVEVTVTEEPTRRKVKQVDSSTYFVASPYKISFDAAFHEFRPGHPVRLIGEVLNVYNEPVPQVPVRMTIFGTRRTINELLSDSFGRVAVDYNTTSSDKSIIYEIRTANPDLQESEQAFARSTLTRYNHSSAVLTINNKHDRYSVGDRYETSVDFEGSTYIFSQAYYIILVRGRIDKLERIPDNDRFGFIIEPHMVPRFRLVVLSYRFDRIVSDSILVHVDGSACDLNLTYINSKGVHGVDVIEPGENGTLLVSTGANSKGFRQVSISGIDEAVYLMRETNTLTQNRLRRQFNTKDTGCGPGGGRNAVDVLLNSGLIIAGLEFGKIGSNCQPRSVKTNKRRTGRSTSTRAYQPIRSLFPAKLTMPSPTDSNSNYLNQCCRLGKIKPTGLASHLTCEERRDILVRNMKNVKCAELFLRCCHEAHTPNVLRTSGFSVASPSVVRTSTAYDQTDSPVTIGQEDMIEEVTLVRSDFRETWLFEVVSLNGSESSVKFPISVPHSITAWRLNALSLSLSNGLCLMEKPVRLISTKDLYMRVDLPYSAVVNEQIEMLVTIFNNGQSRKKVNLFMYGVDGICSEADPGQKTERRLITIEADSVHTEAFALSPIRTGEFKIKIDALTHGSSDVVIKTLNVVPQGITVVDSYNVQLDPRNLQHRKKRSIKRENLVDSIDPDKGEQKTRIDLVPRAQATVIVPDSEECVVSAIADSLGPTVVTTLNNLEHLITKPTGCGEQNVIRMAPTLFTLDYLNATGRLTPSQREIGLKYLKIGYENQLMFRKVDGSFSTFQKRPSSLWLTAFVMRILCKAEPYLGKSMDREVILSAADWLIDHQSSSPAGSWKEFQPILHKSALGGLAGSVPMTAFTFNALRSCGNFSGPRDLVKRREKSLKAAESYLCGKLTSELAKGDPYHLALLGYSLSKTSCLASDSSRRKALITRLREVATYSAPENQMFWNGTAPVEATGYVLLTLLNLRDYRPNELQAIINYLESQRTYTGAFDATQDTIVALEALSTYAKTSFNSNDINLICNITSGRFRKSIEFHEDNAMIMRTFEMNNECDYVDMVTRGTGLGSVRVKYKYNVLNAPEKLCGFELTVNVSDEINTAEEVGSNADLEDLFNITMLAQLGVLSDRVIEVEPAQPDNSVSATTNVLGPAYSSNSDTFADVRLMGTSKITNKLSVCIKRYGSSDTGMVILEIGILSGFLPDEADLQSLQKLKPFISSYEKTTRSVIFYLENIADGEYCISFKIYQEHKVANLQSAMVKVYDYYRKGQGCSQLYHSTRRTDYLKKICNSSLCQCTARWICPLNDNLNEVGEIGPINMQRARDKFRRLLCSEFYNFAWLGRFVKFEHLESLALINFKIGQVLRGEQQSGRDITISMDRDCFDSAFLRDTHAERFLIIGQSRNGSNIHLDSRSIVYDLNSAGAKEERVHNSIVRVVNDFKKSSHLNC